MSRLGGKTITAIPNHKLCDQTHVVKFGSMDEAVNQVVSAYDLQVRSSSTGRMWSIPGLDKTDGLYQHFRTLMMTGKLTDNRGVIKDMSSELEKMVDEMVEKIILEDPRLARKSSITRGVDGFEFDPVRAEEGCEDCMFDRKRSEISEINGGEMMRIVISTDSHDVSLEHAAAFISAAKLAQQFRPIELWWQGAWLFTQEGDNYKAGNRGGYVFLVPLVKGELDYRRMVFCLASKYRDSASYRIMMHMSWAKGMGWDAGVATHSYLENTDDFISEAGMKYDVYNLAYMAAKWAGIGCPEYIGTRPAQQDWKPKEMERKYEQTPEQIRKSDEEWKRSIEARKKAEALAAAKRIETV